MSGQLWGEYHLGQFGKPNKGEIAVTLEESASVAAASLPVLSRKVTQAR